MHFSEIISLESQQKCLLHHFVLKKEIYFFSLHYEQILDIHFLHFRTEKLGGRKFLEIKIK